MNLRSVWLQRFKAETPFVDGKNTYVELVCAVPEIQESKNSKSVYVIGQAENTKYNSKGWVQKENSNGIYEILKKAEEEERYILMRFERQRTEEADKNMDIEDLYLSLGEDKKIEAGRKFTYRTLTGIYNFNNMEWILSNPQSDPKEDPKEVEDWIKNSVMSNEVSADEFFKQREETQDFVPINKSGDFSKKQHLITFYYFIQKKSVEDNLNFTDDNIKDLSRVLLNLSNRIQFMILNNEIPIYNDYSHTVARQILFNLIENKYNISSNLTEKENINNWANSILKDAQNLTKWINEL
jgi:hypothetical protein